MFFVNDPGNGLLRTSNPSPVLMLSASKGHGQEGLRTAANPPLQSGMPAVYAFVRASHCLRLVSQMQSSDTIYLVFAAIFLLCGSCFREMNQCLPPPEIIFLIDFQASLSSGCVL